MLGLGLMPAHLISLCNNSKGHHAMQPIEAVGMTVPYVTCVDQFVLGVSDAID